MIFAILLMVAAGCAVQMARTDWRRRIIPDVYLFPCLLIGLLWVTFVPGPVSVPDAVLGAAMGYALTLGVGYVFARLTRGAGRPAPAPIGLGDVKLMATGGVWLGVTGLAVATVIACVVGMIWGRRRRVRYVPLATFMVPAAFITLIGQWILL
ncbi:prepilin peptidase [bacterium]|nr:prepilin peptidase [bacterium]